MKRRTFLTGMGGVAAAGLATRLVSDLDESSLVFDVGGFEGQWASDIFGRFACRVRSLPGVSPWRTATSSLRRFPQSARRPRRSRLSARSGVT